MRGVVFLLSFLWFVVPVIWYFFLQDVIPFLKLMDGIGLAIWGAAILLALLIVFALVMRAIAAVVNFFKVE